MFYFDFVVSVRARQRLWVGRMWPAGQTFPSSGLESSIDLQPIQDHEDPHKQREQTNSRQNDLSRGSPKNDMLTATQRGWSNSDM